MMDDGWASHDDDGVFDSVFDDDFDDDFDDVHLHHPSQTRPTSSAAGHGGSQTRGGNRIAGMGNNDARENAANHYLGDSSSNSCSRNNNANGGESLFSGFGFGSEAAPPSSSHLGDIQRLSSGWMSPGGPANDSESSNAFSESPTRMTGGLGDGGTAALNAHRHDLNLSLSLNSNSNSNPAGPPLPPPSSSSSFSSATRVFTTLPPRPAATAVAVDVPGRGEPCSAADTTVASTAATTVAAIPNPSTRTSLESAIASEPEDGGMTKEGWDDSLDLDESALVDNEELQKRDWHSSRGSGSASAGDAAEEGDGRAAGSDGTAAAATTIGTPGRGNFLLGRAAEKFGAALLASMDRHDEDDDDDVYDDDYEDQEEGDFERENGDLDGQSFDERDHEHGNDSCNDNDDDINDGTNGRGEHIMLGRQHVNEQIRQEGNDNDDGDDGDETEDSRSPVTAIAAAPTAKSGFGGFGGGFVMKGLSRFIEVATAPVETEEVEDDEDEDGWADDDDDLDFGEDILEAEADDTANDDGERRKDGAEDVSHCEEKKESTKQPLTSDDYADMEPEVTDEDPMLSTEGWDDDIIDVDISTDDNDEAASQPSEMVPLSESETKISLSAQHAVISPSSSRPPLPPSNQPPVGFTTPPPPKQTHSTPTTLKHEANNDVSDSIQDLVAMTESALDSELNNFSWKTPRRETDSEKDIIISGATAPDGGMEASHPDGMGECQDIVEDDFEFQDNTNGDAARDGTKNEPLAVETNPSIDSVTSATKETSEDGDVPKSLSDFANALNAELDSFFDSPDEIESNSCFDGDAMVESGESIDRNSVKAEASTSMETSNESLQAKEPPVQNDEAPYNYEFSKNKSPEPVQAVHPEHPTLPHQQSWYINAMVDGKGGVVYDGTERESDKKNHPKRGHFIDPVASTSDESSLQHTPVGMPLSEMPSRSTSPPISSDSENQLKHSELQCQCLELILPFPENGSMESQEPGYGTKKLPDGSIVLVNYEQLLQNEATKRILLQRSIETFERTIEKLDSRNEASRKYAKEKEEAKRDVDCQLVSARDEIAQLKDLVSQLRLEIDAEKSRAPGSEARLFEEELAASTEQNQELQIKVQSLKLELEKKNDLCNKFEASQKSLQLALEEVTDEKRQLQSDLSESQANAEKLKDISESLQVQCDGLNFKVKELMSANAGFKDAKDEAARLQSTLQSLEDDMSEKAKEIENLKRQLSQSENNQFNLTSERNKFQSECARLEFELSEMNSKLVSLQEEQEIIRSMNTKYETQISELNATIESMCDETCEKDKLAAEVASLRYDLGMKTAECEEAAESLKLMQTKLGCAEARISESSATPSTETLSNVTEPLKAEIEMLEKKVSSSASALAEAETVKTDLQMKLADSCTTVRCLETEVKSLQEEVSDVVNLQEELDSVKKSLEEYKVKFDELSTSRDQLEVDFFNARTEHEEHVSLLQTTISDLDEQVYSLREEYAELQTNFVDTKRKYKEEHTIMTKRYVILAEEEQKLKVELDELRVQYDELSKTTADTISKYEQQVLELQGENLEVSAALEVARKNAAKSAELLETKEQLQQEQYRSRDLQSAIEIATKEKDSFSKKIDDLRQELESVSREKANIIKTLEARASTAEHRNNLLNIESATLQRANTETMQTIAKLNEELQVLKDANAKLEDKLFDMSFDTDKASALTEENSKLRSERDKLENQAASLAERIKLMSSQESSVAETGNSLSADERDALLSRISELEEALKNDTLNDLRDELTSLHEERQELDADNEELLVQLGLMQQNEEEMQAELSEMREQVQALENQCIRLQLDLDESRKACKLSNDRADCGSSMEDFRSENARLCSEIFVLNTENESLKNRINELKQQLENFKQTINQDAEITEEHNESVHLREKIDNLELQMVEREKAMETMRAEYQSTLDSKDKIISELSSEKFSLENAMKDISNKEELKNAELSSLQKQVESLRIENEQVVNLNLEAHEVEEEKEFDDIGDIQNLLAEDIDSDDYLRRQIVILALALERSESQRADAIERVVKERKSNAMSLKQLGESVKRFYSAVRCSDAV